MPVRNEHPVFASIDLTTLRNAVTAETDATRFLRSPRKTAASIALILAIRPPTGRMGEPGRPLGPKCPRTALACLARRRA
jgi:hypothetical protein